jgi:catechol-2,3-dioxygenase
MDQELALNHLNLPARDPVALRQWYVSKLGFKIAALSGDTPGPPGGGAFLWSGGSLLAFVQGDPVKPDQTHFGFRLASLSELKSWVALLKERGVGTGELQGDDEYSRIYVKDPEGNVIELFYEAPPEAGLSLNHLNLPARDPAGLRKWYVEKLGFTSRGGAILWSGGSNLTFVKGEPHPSGALHYGFRLGSLEALRRRVADLRGRGVDVGEVEGDEEYSRVYVKDPEGNQLELFFEKVPEV